MSALGLDDVNDTRGVRAYAPRKPRRTDDESTIRPVLERLNRSEGRVPGPRLVRKDAQVLPAPGVEAVARSAFPMTARLAVAAGVLALVGAAAAGYLAPPSAADHAAAASMQTDGSATSLPKPVQTVSIQRPADAGAQSVARAVKDDARMPQPVASQASPSAETALPVPLRPAANDPSIAPLKAWVALPDSTPSASGWSPATAAHAEVPPAHADASPARAAATPKPDAREPVRRAAPVHHARHVARQRSSHHRRQRTARAQAAPQANQPAQPAEAQPAQPQAVKKLPLQAAIDRMFSGSSANAARPAQQ